MQKGFATFMSTERGFALPLVLAQLLLISLLAAGVYFYYQPENNPTENTPTPQPSVEVQKDETVNWKTYIREGEFQYSYPTDWIINEVIPPQGFSNVGDPKAIYPDGYLSIERVFSRKDCGFEEKEILQGYTKNLKQYDQLLNGVTAKIFEGILVKEKEEYDRKIILIYHNGACFKLDYSSNNSNQKTILDKIISSFKLLN